MEEMQFKTALQEVPVRIDDKRYCVRELNGRQRQEHNQSFELDVQFVDGVPKISTKEGFKMPSEIDLLSKCLYDENDVLVPKKILETWPTTVLAKLHSLATSLSGLDSEAKAQAKNDLKASDSNGIN